MRTCSAMMMQIVRLPQPVIAAVQGTATAAGCQLVASCDLAVASAAAKFGVSGINAGLFCSTPMVALSRNVARKHAMEMLLTGDLISAEHAQRIGLVNQVVPAGQEARRRARARAQGRRQVLARGEARQAGILPPARTGTGGRLSPDRRGDGGEHAGAGWPRKASPPSSRSGRRPGRTAKLAAGRGFITLHRLSRAQYASHAAAGAAWRNPGTPAASAADAGRPDRADGPATSSPS